MPGRALRTEQGLPHLYTRVLGRLCCTSWRTEDTRLLLGPLYFLRLQNRRLRASSGEPALDSSLPAVSGQLRPLPLTGQGAGRRGAPPPGRPGRVRLGPPARGGQTSLGNKLTHPRFEFGLSLWGSNCNPLRWEKGQISAKAWSQRFDSSKWFTLKERWASLSFCHSGVNCLVLKKLKNIIFFYLLRNSLGEGHNGSLSRNVN